MLVGVLVLVGVHVGVREGVAVAVEVGVTDGVTVGVRVSESQIAFFTTRTCLDPKNIVFAACWIFAE